MRLGIIAIGYNRKDVLERLLNRLNECYYDEDALLIISIDHSEVQAVREMAENFVWQHGKKEVITFSERLGLRKHILTCGSYIEKYHLEAAAVFEDDTYPAEDFYAYMKQAVSFYQNDKRIAGISLYTHLWNAPIGQPFQPMLSPYDAFFIQFAQSWGQIWMKEQWKEFAEWYEDNNEEFTVLDHLPQNVCKWPKNSWLKYHIKYCVETHKFFVYPYNALSTCFAEVGEHATKKSTHLQVPLQNGKGRQYRFPLLDQEYSVHYDAFFENIDVKRKFGSIGQDICVDLYGYRINQQNQRYLLTSKKLDYKIVKSFGRELKPHELNCFYDIAGKDVFLYDTKYKERHKWEAKDSIEDWEYFYRKVSTIDISLPYNFNLLRGKIYRRIKRFIEK